jgi:uncharacterized protein YndB with AHSA1/START domain
MVITKSIEVHRSPEDAFRLFVDEMRSWWPSQGGKYTYGGDRAQDAFLESKVGGRFFERYKDGEEFDIGVVTLCDRPHRIVFTWGPGEEAQTDVDVRFTSIESGTRVDIEHRGVEKLGEAAHAFDGGWDEVLSYYMAAASA